MFMCICKKQPCGQHSPKASAKRRASLVRAYARRTPESRKQQTANARKSTIDKWKTDPKWAAKRSAELAIQSLESWQRPGYHEQMVATSVERANRPEAIVRVSTQSKNRWKSKEYREQHSINHSATMTEYWSDPENVEKQCERMGSPEVLAKLSASGLRVWSSKAYQRKMSKIRKELYLNGRRRLPHQLDGNRFEQSYVQSKKGGRVYVRSSWERLFIHMMDSDKLIVKFESEPFAVPYKFKGQRHSYFPDFLVTLKSGVQFLVEIKGMDLEPLRTKAKHRAATKFCASREMEFVVLAGSGFNEFIRKAEPVSSLVQ